MALTEKQERFVREYLRDGNGTAAARRAGYDGDDRSLASIASENLRKLEVSEAIEGLRQKQFQRLELSSERVLRELARLAFVDIGDAFTAEGALKPIHEIPEDTRRAIAGIETDDLFDGFGEDRVKVGVTRKVKLASKDRALELLGKHFKLFTDRVEHDVSETLGALVEKSFKKPKEE